jgi:hypothetical protein
MQTNAVTSHKSHVTSHKPTCPSITLSSAEASSSSSSGSLNCCTYFQHTLSWRGGQRGIGRRGEEKGYR